jgi:hypothetical protein
MEGVLLGAASVAILVGLGALVEAARPRRRGPGRKSDEYLWKHTVCCESAAMPLTPMKPG